MVFETQTQTTSVSRLLEFSQRHINKVVCEQLFVNNLEVRKWEKMLTDFVIRAVENVKPSSRMLDDSMEINDFIKIKIIDWRD